jgi:hypothetical protein
MRGRQSTIIILQLVARSWTATSMAQGREGNGNEQARQKTGFSWARFARSHPHETSVTSCDRGVEGQTRNKGRY